MDAKDKTLLAVTGCLQMERRRASSGTGFSLCGFGFRGGGGQSCAGCTAGRDRMLQAKVKSAQAEARATSFAKSPRCPALLRSLESPSWDAKVPCPARSQIREVSPKSSARPKP